MATNSGYSGVIDFDNYFWTESPGDVVWNQYDNKIWHFYTGDTGDSSTPYQIYALTADANADLSNTSSWTNTPVLSGIAKSKATPLCLPVQGNYLIMIWADAVWNCPVASFHWVEWGAYLKMKDSSGNLINCEDGRFSAYVYSGYLILSQVVTGDNKVWFHRFSVDNVDETNNSWQAVESVSQTPSQYLSKFHINTSGQVTVEKYNSINWFTSLMGAGQTPSLFAIQYLQFSNDHFVFIWAMNENGMPYTAMYYNHLTSCSYNRGMYLKRDPAGRIKSYYVDDSSYMRSAVMSNVSGTGNSTNPFGWGSAGYLFGDQKYSYYPPIGNFVPIGSPAVSGVNTDQQIIEVVFHCNCDSDADDRFIKLQYANYGKLRIARGGDGNVLDLTSLTQNSNQASPDYNPLGKLQVVGYIDGPPPVPIGNYPSGSSSESGRVKYGLTSSSSDSVEATVKLSVGVKTSGNASIGEGVSWNSSLKAGTGSLVGTTEEITSIESYDGVFNLQNNQVSHLGTLFAKSIILEAVSYLFIDDGQSIPASNALQFATIGLQKTDIEVLSYPIFSVQPGNLQSYMESAWSATMGANYIQSVIVPNAETLSTTDDGNQQYLSMAWGNTGSHNQNFGAVTTSVMQTSWFYNAEIYAGAHTGVDFWGVGITADIMAGITTDVNASQTTRNSNSWGVSGSVTVPANPSNPDAVAAYTWRMYYCPANRQWTQELIDKLPANNPVKLAIDPSSACWKIIYTANHVYTNRDLTGQLVDSRLLSQNNQARLAQSGITTVGQLMSQLNIQNIENVEQEVNAWFDDKAKAAS